MKKIRLLLLFLPVTLQAQPSLLTFPQLKDSIQRIVDTEHITGLMVGIATRDSVIFSGGFGYADLENKRKVDNETLFRMGSNTKMLVALGILKLQSEGKISLDDEVRKIAPEVPVQNKYEATNPVRVVHLLEHTSGFDDIKLNRMYLLQKWELTGIDDLLLHSTSMVCRWRPGERHAYSNPNYSVLGYLIEKITQKTYNQYLTEAILLPLGMTHSNFNVYSRLPDDVKEYVFRDGKTQLVPSVTLIGGADGALWSSSDDMIKFLRMFLRNGQPVFDETIIADMETPHSWLGVKEGLKSGYALGNYYTHVYNKYGFRGHKGWLGTCFSTCVYNRELGAGYVIASNSNNRNTKIEELIAAFLEQNAPAPTLVFQPLDKKAIEPYLGFYQFYSPRNEIGRIMDKATTALRIFIEHDTLVMLTITGEKSKLLQTSPYVFRQEGMNISTIAFTQNTEGKNVLSMAGSYFEQGSYAWGLFWRGAMLLMLALIMFSGILAMVSLAMVSLAGAFFKKVAWRQVPLRFLPITALCFLGFASTKLIEKQEFSYALYKFNDVNAETMLIFAGTAFFGAAGLFCIYLSYCAFRFKNRRGAWFWSLAYISVTILAAILFSNGLIALRTWAM